MRTGASFRVLFCVRIVICKRKSLPNSLKLTKKPLSHCMSQECVLYFNLCEDFPRITFLFFCNNEMIDSGGIDLLVEAGQLLCFPIKQVTLFFLNISQNLILDFWSQSEKKQNQMWKAWKDLKENRVGQNLI